MEKLKNGDYCENLTKEQFEELIEIEGHELKYDFTNSHNSLVFSGSILRICYVEKTTLLSFEDFKNRTINTFKK